MRNFKGLSTWFSGLAFLVGALIVPSGGAIAQDAGEDVIEEITVTGSRIKRIALTGANPITVLDAEAIKVTGAVSIGDVLQDLTVNSNGLNVQANNGGNGQTRINLRGLGTPRTLVLVNGRRHVLGAQGLTWAVDLNAIPLAIIDRVEVLKDGASAIYGSDAIAGVVNIITKTDFDGVEMTAFVGQSGQTDGEIMDFNMTVGVNSDRGNMMISAGFYEQDPIFAGDRDFAFFDKSYDWAANDGSFSELGSSAPPQGSIIDRNPTDLGNAAWQALIGQFGAGDFYYNDPSTGWRLFEATGTSDIGTGDYYNYQPVNYLLTPQKRWNVYATGNYNLSDTVNAFVEASYINRQSDQLLAPTPLFIITEGISVDANNFYNPFGRDFIDVRRRFLEAGGRNFLQDLDTFRVVTGFQGDLPVGDGWTWDAYLNYGRTQGIDVNEGRFIRSRVVEAIGPSYVDVNGDPRCGTVANPGSDDCVPLDLFGGAAGRPITVEQLRWIQYTGIDSLFASQKSVAFNVTGNTFELPAGPVGLAFGAEYREEDGADIPDPITNGGDTTGNKREVTKGGYHVTDIYVEVLVPVVESLEASLAVRYSDYSNFGNTTNGKVGLIWRVADSLTLRGTASEAFRAATIPELFLGNADSFPLATDPCDTSQGPRTPEQQETCSADGLPDNYTDSRSQLKSLLGGNPNLKPETADTFTVGLVYQPGWLEGAAVTLDWWDVEVTDSIQGVGEEVILSSCYGQGLANRSLCGNIIRDASGFLQLIDDRKTNIGGVESSGLDVTFTYDQETSFGDFRYNLDIAYLDDYTEIQADGRRVNGKGVYDLGVFAEWKTNFNINFHRGNWGANYNVRFIDEIEECEDDDCSGTNTRRTVDSNWQHDVQLSYDYDYDTAGQARITFGVQNLFDEDPAQIFNGFLATSDSDNYDFLGRYFYLSYNHTL